MSECLFAMPLRMIDTKLKVEVIFEWSEMKMLLGRYTGSFKYIDNVFLRLAGVYMDIHCIHLYMFFVLLKCPI